MAGAAALVWSVFPDLTAAEVKERILDGVDPIGNLGDNWKKPTLTNGRLNVFNALVGAGPEQDQTAPDAIGDLAVAATSFQSVTLSWTATGDDGAAGTAGFYDVRYATSPITEATWETAIRILAGPGPKASGTVETTTVSGLDPNKTHYFALKVRDNQGNESALSNIAQGTTAEAAKLFGDDMENGTNGWTATGVWHQSTLRSYSPVTSWYYGVEATKNYDTGATNSGNLTSPQINLMNAVDPVLIYREWRQVEDMPLDLATVQISTNGLTWTTVQQSELTTALVPVNWQKRATAFFGWSMPFHSKLSRPQWVRQSVDLSAYVGKTIQIRFSFDTLDELFNNFAGWYVDDVMVFDQAAPLPPFAAGLVATPEGESLAIPQMQPTLAIAVARHQAASDFSVLAVGGAEKAKITARPRHVPPIVATRTKLFDNEPALLTVPMRSVMNI